MNFSLALAFGIGVAAGLRTMTAPAAVAWAAHLGWFDLAGTPFALMATTWAVVILTICAIGEYAADLMPKTPARTAPGPLVARALSGMLCGACLAYGGSASPMFGGLAGLMGAMAGAFGGYKARTELVRALHVPDFAVAVPEDLIAAGVAFLLVSRY
jgi:uncharacterized membrane protein